MDFDKYKLLRIRDHTHHLLNDYIHKESDSDKLQQYFKIKFKLDGMEFSQVLTILRDFLDKNKITELLTGITNEYQERFTS